MGSPLTVAASFPSAPTLLEHFQVRAELSGDDPALTLLATGETISFRLLLDVAVRVSAELEARGIQAGDRVGFLTENHWFFHPLLIACASRGAILLPLNPVMHEGELSYILQHAAPSLVLVDDRVPPRAIKLAPTESLAAFRASSERRPPTPSAPSDPDQVALMIYTSGTTGNGKGVMLTQRNLLTNAHSLASLYRLGAKDRLLCVLPLFHMNAVQMTGLIPLIGGSHVFLSELFGFRNAKFYWKRVEELGITVLSLTPSIMAMLLGLFPDGHRLPRSPRFSFCGAAPLTPELWRQFEERFQLPVYQGYGLSETVAWAVCTPPTEPRHYDTVGIPVDCEILIDAQKVKSFEEAIYEVTQVAEDGPTVGEVLLRGPIVMPGYYKDPQPAATFTPDGCLRTGDVGYVDPEGFLHITGRIKDVIVRNGINILSRELDDLLLAHPQVQDSKTFGVKDRTVGEKVVTACVLKPGAEVSDVALREWLCGQLSPYKRPDRLQLLAQLPRTSTGKIATNQLRKLLSGALAEESFTALTRRRFNRAPPDQGEAIKERIQRALISGKPVPFVTYWGCGARDAVSDVDLKALERLQELLQGTRRIPELAVQLTLILTDTHARLNGKPEARIERYYAEVAEAGARHQFSSVRFSELWEEAGLTLEQVRRDAASPEVSASFDALAIREDLVSQAGKHFESGASAEEGARTYHAACLREAPLVAHRFPEHIFLSYNSPEMIPLFPSLPKLFLYSTAKGWTQKPWFS